MTDKIVVEHYGALGDFLLAWPTFVALRRHFSHLPAFYLGPRERLALLTPLGFAPCPGELKRALEGLYSATAWPEELKKVRVFRPGLGKAPPYPASPNFRFLPGLAPGRRDSPLVLYREALADCGAPWPGDWLERFRDMVGAPRPDDRTALLFPGAGHPFKRWPLPRFLELGRALARRGIEPVFVLGPVEVEGGLVPAGTAVARPEDLAGLIELLRGARLAIGNDSGPMHLAGLCGPPGAVLFGPTSPEQWGPPGLLHLSPEPDRVSCAPCAQVTAGAFPGDCPAPACLEAIGIEAVLAALEPFLPASPAA